MKHSHQPKTIPVKKTAAAPAHHSGAQLYGLKNPISPAPSPT